MRRARGGYSAPVKLVWTSAACPPRLPYSGHAVRFKGQFQNVKIWNPEGVSLKGRSVVMWTTFYRHSHFPDTVISPPIRLDFWIHEFDASLSLFFNYTSLTMGIRCCQSRQGRFFSIPYAYSPRSPRLLLFAFPCNHPTHAPGSKIAVKRQGKLTFLAETKHQSPPQPLLHRIPGGAGRLAFNLIRFTLSPTNTVFSLSQISQFWLVTFQLLTSRLVNSNATLRVSPGASDTSSKPRRTANGFSSSPSWR